MTISQYTTGNGIYAECSFLCREPNHGHSANIIFAECRFIDTRQRLRTRYIPLLPSSSTRQKSNTRHTIPLPSSAGQALGNNCARGRRVRQPSNRLTAVIVCRVPVVRHSTNPNLHRVFFAGTRQSLFCECISLALGKYLNFFHCRPQNFLYPIHITCGTPCSNLVYFLMYFIYFMN